MRRYLCIALLLAVALTASAQDVVGRITYLEGTPQIVRDGSVETGAEQPQHRVGQPGRLASLARSEAGY